MILACVQFVKQKLFPSSLERATCIFRCNHNIDIPLLASRAPYVWNIDSLIEIRKSREECS